MERFDFNSFLRWARAALGAGEHAGAAQSQVVAPQVWRSGGARPVRALRPPVRAAALTPFGIDRHALATGGSRAGERGFWMSLDPMDCRRAVIGGSFEQVCAALDRLCDQERHNTLLCATSHDEPCAA
jgi:hypothetical protein